GDVLESARQRLVAVVVLLLGRGRHGGQRAAVEATAHADDVTPVARPVLLCPLASERDGGLVGLPPAARQGAPGCERVLAQELGELRLLGNVEDVRYVEQGRGLLAERADHLGMAVTERGDGDAAREVEILLAVGVPNPRTLASHQGDGLPLRERHEMLVAELDHPLRVHRKVPLCEVTANPRARSPCRCLLWSAPRAGWRASAVRR